MTEYFFVPEGVIISGMKFVKQTTFTVMTYYLPTLRKRYLIENIAGWVFGEKWKKFQRTEINTSIITILN